MCGCVYTDKNGARCRVIVGFGVVRSGGTSQPAGAIIDVKAFGIYAGGGTFDIGYLNQTRIEIQTNANVTIELKK
jgi:hypothetical protein